MIKAIKVYFIPILIVGMLVSACSIQRSAITGDKRAYGYSWEQEKQIGQEADLQIQQQFGLYDNNAFQQYVDKIGQEMLSVTHFHRDDTPDTYKDTDFYFRILDSPVVNAFALPGGYIYVTRGLLSHLDNEAQLAVVLGHEIGHVVARHASQRAFIQQMSQIALVGGAIAGQHFLGIPGGDILGIGGMATQMLFLSYSREDERESDRLGVEYASRMQYQSAEGAHFFISLERMSDRSGQSIPSWSSTHPDPAERATSIPELAEEWRAKGYDQTIVNTDQYMGMLDNMIYGENPREGFTRNNTFYHPELKFQFSYPSGWQVINQRSLVAVVNRDQNAVSIMTIDSKSPNAEASVNEFLNQEGIVTTGKSNVNSRGLRAYHAEATGQTQEGDRLTFYLYSVEYDGTIYRFINYTAFENYGNYTPRFVEITEGFRQLTDLNILTIQPIRLQSVKVTRSGTFRSFLPANLDQYHIAISAEEIAIMNQVGLDDRIEVGQWVKIPR
jgi:predicted Zn-dependent protease